MLVQSCPRGYPRLAALADSDENFMIYRRFGYLQSRLLLEKQDELRSLEEELEILDARMEKQDPVHLTTRDLPPEVAVLRKELMEQIEKTFCDYGEGSNYSERSMLTLKKAKLVSAAQNLVSMNKPSNSEYKSVENFVHDERTQCEEEETWIQWKEDLMTLRPGREHAWLDAGIEHLLRHLHCRLVEYVFCSKVSA